LKPEFFSTRSPTFKHRSQQFKRSWKVAKFHPEFNFIERYWGMVKFRMRGKCDYTFATLQAQLPAALAAPTIGNIRRFARKSADYMYAYQNGCKNPEDARGEIKIYKTA